MWEICGWKITTVQEITKLINDSQKIKVKNNKIEKEKDSQKRSQKPWQNFKRSYQKNWKNFEKILEIERKVPSRIALKNVAI